MERLPLDKLGARVSPKDPYIIEFGLFLPEILATENNQVFVKIIHEHDQFLQCIPPHKIELQLSQFDYQNNTENCSYWSQKVEIKKYEPQHPKSSWGKKGKYLYRYFLKYSTINADQQQLEIDWIIDPFAREFGIGKLSAFTVENEDYQWSKHEQKEWKTPALNDLIIYEMMISEFGRDLKETINRLDYLADLGVNCINIMPISNVVNTIDWGYKPIGYFGIDERFGKTKHLKKLIDYAHQKGIAVILDVVYAHTEEHFAYSYLYRNLEQPNPLMGKFGDMDGFGKDDECTNFDHPFIQDFFYTVNCYLLEEYHIDGFRYDFVPGYWDGPVGKGYANLTYNTYQEVKSKANIVQHKQENWKDWQRFFNNNDYETLNLIQCAEQLQDPKGVLHETYSNCTWQNRTLYTSKQVSYKKYYFLDNLALSYSLYGYPNQVNQNGDTQIKTALQYIETHDHPRFVCNWGCKPCRNEEFLQEGDREENWYKVQPYLIGVLTAKGIPLIWQGQEFAENYYIPPEGAIRVMLFRPVRWDYFYDKIGQKMIYLVRKLIQLRRQQPQFRSFNDDSYYFQNHYGRYQSNGVLIVYRKLQEKVSLIALNFSDEDQTIKFRFPDESDFQLPSTYSGNFTEELHGEDVPDLNLKNISKEEEHDLLIPSNYGRIWTLS
ncbi:alpha amylase, catalytic domain protein [Lyngbya aestuarii BL J]|uniref:Alpha amylase, catalytic domain protein n=1 Tax=Lyngbya aestuarii BL J TaxID=1348334 RepID=U7QLT3_9CYAN|nr:alpha-amylase family glycosyl hydrolase [Lyngbya aestuarii]ERT08848.1 alpha amylase, catalytic domain protein [Lyngbya aestuarii BL J]